MKSFLLLFCLLIVTNAAFSQKSDLSTSQFTISGLVEKPVTVTYEDLNKESIIKLGDLKITNHLGEFKKEYKNLKGVRLLDVLKKVTITAASPKLLSQYYFVLKASDGYAAVISWNELYNTELGNTFYLITEADNKPQQNAPENILFIAAKDFKTGRRHIKGLTSIEIKQL